MRAVRILRQVAAVGSEGSCSAFKSRPYACPARVGLHLDYEADQALSYFSSTSAGGRTRLQPRVIASAQGGAAWRCAFGRSRLRTADGCDTSLPLNSSWHACRSIEGSLVSVLPPLAHGGLRIAR